MQIRSQPCQCPVCSVHPIFGSLHMGALLGRPWLRCSLCHWLLRRWRRGYYWRRLKQWQRSEKINQFKKPLANYQIPQNAMLSSGFPPIFPFFTRTFVIIFGQGLPVRAWEEKKQRREMQPGNQPHASWVLREVQKYFFDIENAVPVSFLHRLVENCAGSVLREWIL